MSKRTVQDVEGGRRRGREDYEEEGEQSEAGSGIQRADAATLAQRRLLRVRPGAAGQQQQQGGGAFANINSGASNNNSAGSEDRFKQSAESAGKPFTWGAGFYNPPQPKIPAPSYDLINGGNIDNKEEKDAEFDDEKKEEEKNGNSSNSDKKDNNEDASTATKSSSSAPGWTANPFTSSAAAGTSNPFASSTSSNTAAGTSASSANPFNSSSSASFTFSFAPPPSSMPASSSTATTTEANDNNKNGKSALAAAPTVSTTEATETEKVIYETEQCKLYLFFKDEETKQSSWKERGGGSFKIVQFIEKDQQGEDEESKKKNKAWLVMRNPQTRKVILSCPVDETLKIGQTQEMQLMFTSAAALDIYGGPPPKDAVQSFLLRANKAASKDIIATAVKNIKEQQERVQ